MDDSMGASTYQGLAINQISHCKCTSRHALLGQLRVEILKKFSLGLGTYAASLFDIGACCIVYMDIVCNKAMQIGARSARKKISTRKC